MSSEALKASENFIRLILETKKSQAVLLLSNPTPQQAEALSEIARNLLDLEEDIPKNVKTAVKRRKGLFKKLAKVSSSIRTKLSLVKKHARTIFTILMLVKDSLLLLL